MKRMTRHLSLWMLLAATLLAWQSAMARELPDFTELVEQAAPGVVNISTTRMERGREDPFGGFGGQEIPEIFRHFFGDRFPAPPGGGGQGRSQERQSLGSGFIISEDGYILTNAHVVQGADEILVRLNDRRELAAELIGADERTDVALLRVDADDLPTLTLGDSDALRVGEWVAAIGSPFGFDSSVTAGIISAINRTLPRDAYVPFIQTDVAINPGNSGGPLFNLDGEVVGINSQIFTRSGGFMGLSFAIPINVAMDVAGQLRDDGRVSRGWLGVMIQPVSRDLAESFGMDSPSGALIADLDPEGPAARGGLQAGDVILEVDGDEVDRSSTLPRLIGRTSPGSEVDLVLLRDGEEHRQTVTVGDWPDAEGRDVTRAEEGGRQSRLGLAVSELEADELERLGIEDGVRVRELDPSGAAAAAGIRPGDVLVSIDHQVVGSADRLVEVVESLPSDRAVPVRLYRDGRSLFVALRLADD
ncbi:DegQ family serine endoprotease [Halomonas heilongjiangensis]|uniref:Probable periplasmic serine endoprotease DegP-like n=1 Tax=Halomonas heilongjiangensis TaxID=1387883 RepID=A0A2N7TTK3_9GAMM|nr:DegQ family serine endoprotease [Halomonas heilongjiangensis]PMR71468.1 serine peptidase [Halomonas heilongjiangensis]PXX86754.1 serine peptidase [Halomonas heilongjiangensis]